MYFVLVLLCWFLKESYPLRMVSVSVPPYRVRGQSAQLQCRFQLDSDSLYSVKWYRDHEEFYRYMPKNDPVKFAYKLDGIKVDLSRSTERVVWLQPVTLKSRGVYRCEVSAEAPSFASAAAEGRMEVIYLPKEGPKITVYEVENTDEEYILLNCTSGRSYPPATLSWHIDGEEVTDPSMLLQYDYTEHAHGLVSAALGLRVPAGRSVRTRCAARVAPATPLLADTDLPLDMREALLLVHSGSEMGAGCIYLLILTLVLISRGFPVLTET